MPIPDKEPEKGTFSITVTVVNGKQTNKPTEAALNEILQQFNKNLGFVLDRMTPGERKSNEPIMKVEALSHGEFKGYRAPSNQSEKFRSRTTNGRFLIDSRLSHSELPNQIDLPITPEDVPRILETLEVVEGH